MSVKEGGPSLRSCQGRGILPGRIQGGCGGSTLGRSMSATNGGRILCSTWEGEWLIQCLTAVILSSKCRGTRFCQRNIVVFRSHFFGSLYYGSLGATEEELKTPCHIDCCGEHDHKANHCFCVSHHGKLGAFDGMLPPKTPAIFPISTPLIDGLSGSNTTSCQRVTNSKLPDTTGRDH